MPLALPSLLLAALAAGDPAPPPPAEDTWVDRTHEFVETRVFAPVLRLDRFFSDEQALEEQRARSFLRWRTQLRFDAEARPAFGYSLRANLRLPGLNKWLRRVRIVVEGQTREALDALLPEERDAQDGRTFGSGDAEVRFDLWKAMGARADLGAGVLFSWPPGGFGRARLRWRWVPFDRVVTRSSLSGFWRTDTRFGTQLDVHVERPFELAEPALVRLGSDLLLTEVSRGLEWSPDLTLLVALGPRTAAALGASATWTSEPAPGPRVERYRLSLRLRRDFFRRWLFFEVEPELYWPWSPERGRHAAWATTLRVEVQFHGTPRRRDAPTEEEQEEERDEPRNVAPSARER